MTGNFLPALFLLQQDQVTYFKEDDPFAAMMLLIGVGAVIFIVLVINIARHGISRGPIRASSGRAGSERKVNVFQIRKAASSYGFDKDQTKLLEYIFRNEGLANPERVLQNDFSLDKYFKRAYKNIEKRGESEEEVQNFLSLLFSVRNTLESANHNKDDTLNSTKRIAENMAGVLTIGKETSYPVRVLSSKGDHLLVGAPMNALGTPIRFPRGTRATISFFTKSSHGFSFTTQILGDIDTPRGHALQLTHSSQVQAMAKRRFKRKEVKIGCEYSLVHIQEMGFGRKRERKMVADPRRFRGSILDLSAGGCAIKTSSDIHAGAQLKITFQNTDGVNLAALGQVIRTNQSRGLGMILHIKFLKTTRRSLNSINAIVFEYDQD